jgi:hypothetical protein
VRLALTSRIAVLTGHEAATIHRLLQLRPGGDASPRRRSSARRGPRGGRDLDGRRDPGQQADHGDTAGFRRLLLMLKRNLLHTGVTRARKLVVLVGSRRALAVAVRTKGAGRRHTALDYRLRTRLAVEESKPARFPGVVSFN